MDSSRFDELTKALATSTTRRAALRRMGSIVAGVSLAGFFPGLAFAKNKTCAQFCAAVFGDNTPAAEQCAADAAHGTGLCYSCGSSTPASSICCTRNSSGFCSSYSLTLTCACPSGQVCQNGQCVQTTYKYVCTCDDFSIRSTCNTLPCGPETAATVCVPLCADTGGFLGIHCFGPC